MVTARATRSRRASRKASPTGRAANPKPTPAPVPAPAVAAPSETPDEKEDSDDVWQEPPLLSPRPSYMEYPWIEKQPVCDGMLPLGTMPPANRRVKNKVVLTPAVRRKREREAAEMAAMEAARPRTRSPGSDRPAVTQAVVDAAVEKAERAGHDTMARTLKRCFAESLEKPELAELLAAILSHSATVEERDRFVGLVKNIRRQLKAETVAAMATNNNTKATTMTTTTTTSPTTSPTANNDNNDNNDNNNNKNKNKNTTNKKVKTTATAATTTTTTTTATAKTDERARATRSRSDSSSSLSSLGSLVEGSPFEFSAGPAPVTQQGSGKAAVPKARSQKSAALQAADQRRPSSASKRSLSQAGLDEAERNAVLAAKRQKLVKQSDIVVEESEERTSLTSLREPDPPSRLPSSTQNPRPTITLKLRAPGGADAEDEDRGDDDDGVPHLPRSRRKPSRAQTPVGSQSRPLTPDDEGRIPRRVKTARVKKSPLKRKAGQSAGMIAGIASGAVESRAPAAGHGGPADRNQDHNHDYCSACGGNGRLICCDSCARSFHFTCLNKAVDEKHLPQDWFCPHCSSTREPQPKRVKGLFGGISETIDKKNPVAYHLPGDIRGFFEWVGTGEAGEYADAVPLRSHKYQRVGSYPKSGVVKEVDLLMTHDSKGNPIVCGGCRKMADGVKWIAPCDVCETWWHLDCQDPPQAKFLGATPAFAKDRPPYMCPLHAEHVLLGKASDLPPEGDGRAPARHKARRPKKPKTVNVDPRRVFANNGVIDVSFSDWGSSGDEGKSPHFLNKQGEGVVYRMPAKGIIMNFLGKCNREHERAEAQKAADERARLAAMSGHEREAVNVLAQMGRPATTAQPPIPQQNVGSLADALSSQLESKAADATHTTVAANTRSRPASAASRASSGRVQASRVTKPRKTQKSPVSAAERASLERLRALIDSHLASATD